MTPLRIVTVLALIAVLITPPQTASAYGHPIEPINHFRGYVRLSEHTGECGRRGYGDLPSNTVKGSWGLEARTIVNDSYYDPPLALCGDFTIDRSWADANNPGDDVDELASNACRGFIVGWPNHLEATNGSGTVTRLAFDASAGRTLLVESQISDVRWTSSAGSVVVMRGKYADSPGSLLASSGDFLIQGVMYSQSCWFDRYYSQPAFDGVWQFIPSPE